MFKWGWRTLFFCFALVVGWSVFQCVIRPGPPFYWDEAAHSLKGLLIAHDVRSGDWLSFLYDTYKQVYWPPLHSWLIAIAFLIAGPSQTTARALSCVCFLLGALVIYLAALQFRQRNREIAATVAATLFLTSPLVIKYSGQAMLEIPGVLFISLTALIYIVLHNQPRPDINHVWLGIAIICAYFTRTNYGILLCLVWVIAVYLNGGMRALFSRSSVFTALPIVVAFAIWFAYPPKIQSTWKALVNIPWGMEHPYSLAGLLYYPNLVLHYFGSVWQSILPISAFVLAFSYWKNPALRFLILLGLSQLGLGIVYHQRLDRHMIAMAPALTLAAGFVFAECWSAPGRPAWRWTIRMAAIGVCLLNAMLFPWALHAAPPQGQSAAPDRIAAAVSEHRSSLVLGTREIHYPSPPGLDWRLAVDMKLLAVTHSGVTMNREEDRKIWRIADSLPLPSWFKNRFKQVVSRGDVPAKVRTIYLGLVDEYAGDEEKARRILGSMDAASPFEVIFVVAPVGAEKEYPFQFIDETIRPLGFEPVSTESFEGTDLRGDLYRRKD
jgi:hypothetical protein